MSWKKAVILVAIAITVIMGIMTVRPAQIITEFRESTDIRLAESSEIPFIKDFSIKGLAISGSWEGSGYAEVWMIANDKKYLVMDTRKLPKVLEFSTGTRFEAACIDTCVLPPMRPERLYAMISGPGFLIIDQYHFAVQLSPSGMAACKNCRQVKQPRTLDHSMLLLTVLLLVAVVGSHSLGHRCRKKYTKHLLIIIFIGMFITLAAVFGVSLTSPTSALIVTAKRAASISAAIGFLTLFSLISVEMAHKE